MSSRDSDDGAVDSQASSPLATLATPLSERSIQGSGYIATPATSNLDSEKLNDPILPLLDQYVPLGCLTLVVEEEEDEEACSINGNSQMWEEATITLPSVSCAPKLWTATSSLWKASWIRVFRSRVLEEGKNEVWRIHLLPDDVARRAVDRNRPHMRKHLDELISNIDVSPITWEGYGCLPGPRCAFDKWATAEGQSLFYLFNTLPSPSPDPVVVRDRHSRAAMRSILHGGDPTSGLKTSLYAYQKRSAAEMLRRETAPQSQLDPRLEERHAPTGELFFYGAREGTFLKHARHYDAVRGGILAETMGYGKTLICIALILSTRGHWPVIPPHYTFEKQKVRQRPASLLETIAATLSRYPIPWRKYFDDIEYSDGYKMSECIKTMEAHPPKYEIPPLVFRVHRNAEYAAKPEIIQLSSGTIVVVPKNLMSQWRSELSKHVEDKTLRLLLMEDRNTPLPPAEELATYDVILFSRPRFESEDKGAEEFYESPLKKLHFLRMIIDEGHSFSSSNTKAATVADKLVRAERRWIVSGTPARDLMGVEVDLSAMTNRDDYEETKEYRQNALEQRKKFNMYQEDSSGAIKSLGSLTSRFLKAQPWGTSYMEHMEEPAKWEDHIYRHENAHVKTYTSFSSCLRRTLENLVIKTQPVDIERDIDLPPLTHKIVRLTPSFFDKVTANLFVLLFITNAVTSERRDMDYLFHKSSQHHLHRLIANLRQSAFFWVGLDEKSIRSTLEIARKYLAKDNTDSSADDRQLLINTMAVAEAALSSEIWKNTTKSSVMGIFVQDWPGESSRPWAFPECESPMTMGLTQSIRAQRHIDSRLNDEDPLAGFEDLGIATNAEVIQEAEEDQVPKLHGDETTKANLPPSSLQGDVMELKRLPASGASGMTISSRTSPKKKKSQHKKSLSNEGGVPKKAQRGPTFNDSGIELTSDTRLGRSSIIGTTSAKLSYLIDRVQDLHAQEKILIFYEGNHIAYYLSEMLDLLHIKYLVYANTLSGEQRSKYILLFDSDESQRVLIMDIKQAAHGLNLASASRVFFVNPVCRPAVEAQAIKRAHRIGQTKPVRVETLILRGTVEEAMHDRASKMTSHEHLQAKTLEDDLAIARIIQQARILPFTAEELQSTQAQMAKLQVPQQIFGRPGRKKDAVTGLEEEIFGGAADGGEPKRKRAATSRTSTAAKRRKKKDEEGDLDAHAALLVLPANEAALGSQSSAPEPQTQTQASYISIFGNG